MQIFGHFYQVVWADSWTLGQNRGQDLLLIVSGWVENMAMPTSKPEKKEPKKPLSVTHPELAKEAVGWDANKFTSRSGAIVTWKCKQGHIWQAIIANRVRTNGCPYCTGRLPWVGFNDLKTTHPELASQAFGWDPRDVTERSSKKLSWMCPEGHNYEAAVYHRKNGSGCPFCSGQKTLSGFNDLTSTHPDLAKEAFTWDPTKVSKGTDRKFQWKCKSNHIFVMAVSARTQGGGCPYCSGSKVLAGFNDIKTTDPDLAVEAFGWDPEKVSRGSTVRRSWKCSDGHTWIISPNGRTSKGGTGCPVCSNQRLLVGFNDLKTTHPELASQAFGWDPGGVVSGNKKKAKWKCEIGHFWVATIASRATYNLGCPVCSNRNLLVGFNDLKTTHPELASQAFGWDPESIVAGAKSSKVWKCEKEHTWKADIGSRSRMNLGCPYCSNHKILVGFNDLQTTNPELAKEAVGWDTSTVTGGSLKKYKWQCSVGHKYISTVRDRAQRDTGCPICSGRIVLVGFNDLKSLDPLLATQAYKWNPETVTPHSNFKKMWKCTEGHIWESVVSNRSNGRGCPSCSISGFDPNKDGYLYFVSHQDWEMLQIGITNVPDDRLKDHKKLGWEVLELRGPMDGHLTQQWESAILRMLKAKGADLSNEKIAGKFDGYSEAWTKATFPVGSIKELMRLTDEFEEGLGKGSRVE